MPLLHIEIALRFNPYRCLPATESVALSVYCIQLFMAEMDVQTLQSFSQVCQSYTPMAHSELALRIYHALKLHISDYRMSSGYIMSYTIRLRCRAFLDMLQRTGSVVAGQAALSVLLTQTDLDGTWQDERDLEILAPRDAVPRVLTYLVQYERYCIGRRTRRRNLTTANSPTGPTHEVSPAADIGDDAQNNHAQLAPSPQSIHGEAIESITLLNRDRDDQRIIIIESTSPSALIPLAASSTTLLANYFTSTTLVAMYPKLSLKGIGIRNPNRYGADDEAIVERYTGYGFRIEEAKHKLAVCSSIGSYCPRHMRRSEDAWSFTMAFGHRTISAKDATERHWRVRSYIPETYWVWGGWDDHAQHPGAPFVAPEFGIFVTN